jgi:predicted transcriptional regulator
MIIWITTVGWSPFAVINPIWAYCKENDECPNKIILIFTPFKKIKFNLDICQRYISEILKAYNGKKLNKDSIIIEEIENDNIEIYADRLNKIIERERNLKIDKIILDMTPGRKYMSAINVYYGYNLKDTPIQVFYLHLEESKYQDVPYPLTPIIKNELMDILESTEIFSTDISKLPEISIQGDKEGNDYYFKDEEAKKEYLILLSIDSGFNTKTKIRKYTYTNQIIICGHELDKILKGLITRNLVDQKSVINDNQKFKLYNLTDKGKNILMELKQKITIKNQGVK